ncbi:MAG TPA: hypothetical protein VFC38_01400 [Stellaceae bacterium]|nr:hypothetical protein [Stellaceae bacterium]
MRAVPPALTSEETVMAGPRKTPPPEKVRRRDEKHERLSDHSKPKKPGEKDIIDEMGEDSFPASDPPSY